MRVEYINTDNFEDIEKFKNIYEQSFDALDYRDLIQYMYGGEMYIYVYYFNSPDKNEDKLINIAFSYKTIDNVKYLIYSENNENSDYIDKFKKKVELYMHDVSKFDNFNEEKIIKGYESGFLEMIYKIK